MLSKKNNIFDIVYFALFLALALFIPLSKTIVVYIVALVLITWLAEKPWYLAATLIYVAIVWHTKNAIYIAGGIIAIIILIELVLYFTGQYKRSHFYLLKYDIFRRYILSFSIIYLIYFLGLIYTSNMDYGAFDLEVKFSLFIFPLVLSTSRTSLFSKSRITYIMVLFITGCLLSTLISFGNAISEYAQSLSLESFYYRKLSYFHHPGYLAMYLNFAIVILICFLLKNNKSEINFWYILSFVFLIVYFSIFIILLSSKAGIISLLVVFLLTVGYIIVIEKKIIHGLALIVLIFAMFFISMKIFTYSLNRIVSYQEVVEQNIEPVKDTDDKETGDRLTIWKSSFEVVKEHFFIGVGTGDVKDVLIEKYKKHNSLEALTQQKNAHNQFLQILIALGIIGFLVLIIALILPAYYALKHGSYKYLLFLIIIVINFLVESMLETQAGVVFYAFFNSFLFFEIHSYKKESERLINK